MKINYAFLDIFGTYDSDIIIKTALGGIFSILALIVYNFLF